MKPKSTLRHLIAALGVTTLAVSPASAQSTYTWANSNVVGTPTSPLNWINPTQGTWTGGTPVSSNLNTIQFFANNTTALTNTANPSTQTSNVDNGGAAFELGTLTLSGLASATTNANLTETISGDALNFSAATGTINLDALNATRTITYNLNTDIQLGTASSAGALTLTGNGTSAFNIGGSISELQVGGGSLVKSGSSTVTLSGANSYTGTTTVNGGTLILTNTNSHTGATTLNAGTLSLSGAAGAVTATSGLAFNGGGLTLTNTVAETGSGRMPDTAGITSNGGTLTYTNTSGANIYAETIGSVALTSGQMNFNLATNQTGAGSQTLTLAGLTQSGSGSATFSAATTSPNATKNRILVSGATQTPAGQIIGPWATTGTAANSQNDYAVYDASGYLVPANIAASAENTWANDTDAYTLSTPAKTATALTATRNIFALKASSTASAASITASSPTITVTGGHSFAVGDPVAISSFSGDLQNFNVGRLYYVASVSGSTLTLAATPGGVAISTGTTGRNLSITGGLKLDNLIDLGTTGILNSGDAPLAIGRTADGGNVTLPTAGAGNLYLTTGLSPVTSANSGLNGRISIEAPIVDNGGALTLVKNGAGVLRLQGTNTYTGGTVINSGTVIFTADNNFGAASNPISFNGSGALSFGPNTSWAFSSGGTVPLSRPVTVNNGAIAGFYYNSPNTTMNISGDITGDGGIISGKDPVVTYGGGDGTIGINFTSTSNTFTGPLTISNATATFNSLADSSGAMILNSNFTYGGGATANLSIPSRLVDVRGNVTITNSAGSTRTMTLGNVSTTTSGAKTLTLSNANTNGAGFVTGNITNGAGTIAITKTGNGAFTLSGTNTYSGITGPDNTTLTIRGKNALSPNSIISFDPSNGAAGAGAGRLNLYMDDAGSIALGNQINVRTAQTSGGVTAQWTIDVGNNGGATTGSTLVLGKMNFASISDPRAGGYILNVTGANGYGLQIGDVDLAPSVGRDGGTGSGTFQPGQGFNPTTAPLTITGTVRQNAASVAASGVNVGRLVLWGTNTGNSISGAIMDPADFPGNANAKALGITKGSTGTWSLSSTANTFTGSIVLSSTTTSAGTLSYASAGGANAISFSQTTGSATLSYTGSGQTMSGPITANALTTGTITLDASGSGAINYSNTGSLGSAGSGIRKLVLSGSNTGDNILAGQWVNNTGAAATLTKNGAGTWVLTGNNTYTGLTSVTAGTLKMGANDVIPDGSNISIGTATLDADTRTDTAGTLDVTGAATINLGSGAALAFADSKLVDWTGGTLNITGTLGATSLRFGDSADDLTEDQLDLISVNGSGLGTYVLNSSGYLVSGGGDVTPPTLVSITDNVSGGPVTVGNMVTYTVTFDEDMDSGTVDASDFNNAGTAAVTIGSVTETTPGVFTVQATPTSAGSLTLRIVGPILQDTSGNNLVVPVSDDTTITVQTAYDAWSGGALFDADANGDGVNNGLAFLLGASGPNVNALALLPEVTESSGNLVLTFDMLDAASRGTATLSLEHSSDLGIIDLWEAALVPDADNTVNDVVFDISGTGTLGVQATIPSSKAAGGKLFGRLKATQP
jgi:fibronectin-binding autotransporter adhesin